MGQYSGILVIESTLPKSGSFDARALDERVQRHLAALRVRNGEHVNFLNGRGGLWICVCQNARDQLFEVLETKEIPQLRPQIDLYLAPPKGDALTQAVTQATECGAARIAFLKSDFAQYRKEDEAPGLRAQRVSDAACEQCLRPWRCEVNSEWLSLDEALAAPGLNIVADEEEARSGGLGFADAKKASSEMRGAERLKLFIGPEGGWSESERKILRAKALTLGLGSLILRTPTACVAALHHLRVQSET
jgi:16S rRNA (uracil1498-N3)-methyltransferase